MDPAPIPMLERPAYFDGQRLAAADLERARDFDSTLRRLHNRALHGWGVVAGLAATGGLGARAVQVSPGLALDAGGRELLVPAAVEVAVPPVAGESDWLLVVSGLPDDELATVERLGACGSEGAVRLLDVPAVRWLDATGKGESRVREGYDVVLARGRVRGCKLAADLDLSVRRPLPAEQPYAAAGQTPAGRTSWRWWPGEASRAGVVTTVDTTDGGFRTTPVYQARLAGDRAYGADVYEGFAQVLSPSATAFDFCVVLPSGALGGTAAGALNPSLFDGLPDVLGGDLSWQVVWMGVETS